MSARTSKRGAPTHWEALVAQGRIAPEYAVYINSIPAWAVGMTFIAALTRFFGGLALLCQHSSAFVLYAISFVSVVLIMYRGFVLAGAASVIRNSQVVLELVFFALSAFAVWYSYVTISRAVLR